MNWGLEFYRNKKILVTGHTGFKGTWLCKILELHGAKIVGYALPPRTNEDLFQIIGIEKRIKSIFGDIRDYQKLFEVFNNEKPEIVFHLAAQPLVRDSYEDPVYTYQTNVLGTVNICECIRNVCCVKSFLNITTDKVYQNKEWEWGYRENESLGGCDPYSSSKACSELITQSYNMSFLKDLGIAVSTARAGNVIGGGDFAKNRIIPDCLRAAQKNEDIVVRNPCSTRPYQHVLEPLLVYLIIAKKQYEDKRFSGCYNVGPEDMDSITTGELAELFCKLWGKNQKWIHVPDNVAVHEAGFLKLDCSKVKSKFGWKPNWNVEKAVKETINWYKAFIRKENMDKYMEMQIKGFLNLQIQKVES